MKEGQAGNVKENRLGGVGVSRSACVLGNKKVMQIRDRWAVVNKEWLGDKIGSKWGMDN